MTEQERIFNKIAEALLVDYTGVYYVNAVTNEYCWYSISPEFHSLQLEQGGDDFFKNIIRDCKQVVYEEDQHIFIEDIQKEKLLHDMKKGSMQSIEYRLMINGEPVWHALRLIRGVEEDSDYFVLGVINIDEEYRQREQGKETARQMDVFDQITTSLAGRYDTIYYVDIDTSTYVEISSTDDYKKLNVPVTGSDFFSESRRSIRKYVHPDDQEFATSFHYKDVMLKNLEGKHSFSIQYRLVVEGEVRYIRHTEVISKDKKHIVVCIENIDAEVKTELERKASEEKSVTYTRIAETLASSFDLIYYVDCWTEEYIEFSTQKIYGELEVQEEGGDFFAIAMANADKVVHSEDRARLKGFVNKDYFISQLDNRRKISEDYRMVVDGGKPQYTRMTVSWSSDKSHFIICIENRDSEVLKEREHLQALNSANEMARRDELTHTRNMTAYQEMEQDLQIMIDEQRDIPFGIVVCDINDLKVVNDTRGHKAGDELIKDSCKMICHTFSHSPVFRIGGDEFVAILKGRDYEDDESLVANLKGQVEGHVINGDGPVVAVGFSEFDPRKDKHVSDVFNRADTIMYKNKAVLKEQKLLQESYTLKEKASAVSITEDKRKILDNLYKSFDLVAESGHVFVCDIKYDFSRWSKGLVEEYHLPSEYMYGAGDIWEDHIHPDDRHIYREGIDAIFAGNAGGHDLKYRVKQPDGDYVSCTCRGLVIRDAEDAPDYFVGVISF